MSLLIKALDKAEQDQAKHDKTAKIETSQPSAEWSLETINEKPISENPQENISNLDSGNNTYANKLKLAEQNSSEFAKLSDSAVDNAKDDEADEISIAEFSAPPALSANQGYSASSKLGINHSRTNKAQDQARLNQHEQAANVFTAKELNSAKSVKKIALIGVAGLLALLLTGAGLYNYLFNKLVLPTQPNLVQTPPQNPAVITPVAPTQVNQPEVSEADTDEVSMPTTALAGSTLAASEETNQAVKKKKADTAESTAAIKQEFLNSEANSPSPKNTKSVISSPSTSVTITKNKPVAAINPSLLNAYQAYTAGDDTKAQKLYLQVLQNETRNVDAMLGLAAIAQLQNRTADAADWYKKVLELDPKNAIAQASLISTQLDDGGQGDVVTSESRLKNLLAQQPENASLQAALGGLYADQNQWPSAQQAYFEAHRLAPSNADYTFNLAASLDQMGKPKLALPYYKRTLELLPTAANTGISEVTVRARIKAIE